MWTFDGKSRSIINKVRTFELVFCLHCMPYSPGSLGAPKRIITTIFEVSTRVTYGGHHSIRSRLTSWGCRSTLSGNILVGFSMYFMLKYIHFIIKWQCCQYKNPQCGDACNHYILPNQAHKDTNICPEIRPRYMQFLHHKSRDFTETLWI